MVFIVLIDIPHPVRGAKIFFFSKRRRYKYIRSVIEKLEIPLQMEFDFRDGNEAGATQ